MISGPAFGMRFIDDGERARRQITPGTVRRVLPYFTRHRWTLAFLFLITAVDSAITVVNPVLLGFIVDDGVLRRQVRVIVALSLAVAGLALLDALTTYIKSWRPDEEAGLFAGRATRIRDLSVSAAMWGQLLVIGVSLLAGLTTALIYGLGGTLVVHGVFQLGTLVAMVTLITRLYGPVNQVSAMQVNFLTSLVAFDRVFEILDLKPLVTERPGASPLPGGAAPAVEFDHVWFRYPAASEVSLPSLEQVTLAAPERAADTWVLRDVSFRVPAGKLTALVGPSGAGKTTITHLVPRLYDPVSGTVRLDGRDVRDLTLTSLRATIGVVPQDAHLFHDTIRAKPSSARSRPRWRDAPRS
jgi:ABC-type multidrug transport system fused ATPase/permease subunit